MSPKGRSRKPGSPDAARNREDVSPARAQEGVSPRRASEGVSPTPPDPAQTIGDHDPEGFARHGMSEEAIDVDEAETMASSGDASNSFQEIASGSATGLGIDRGESIGTGGLAAGEDDDAVAAGDWWRQRLEDPQRPAERSAERFDLEGRRLGWENGADLEERQLGLDNKKRGRSPGDREPPTGGPEEE